MIRTIALLAIAASGVSVAASATEAQAPKPPVITDSVYTKPQQLVDVGGGRRINLYCRGTGSPTVVFDAGLGDSSIA